MMDNTNEIAQNAAAGVATTVDHFRYPELGQRYRSMLIDLLVVVVLMFAAGQVFEFWPGAPAEARIIAFALVWAGYEPIAVAMGCTLGNYVMGIRVRAASDGIARVNILRSYVRYATKGLLGWLSFLTVSANPRRRAIHDVFSGTIMVRTDHFPDPHKEGGMLR